MYAYLKHFAIFKLGFAERAKQKTVLKQGIRRLKRNDLDSERSILLQSSLPK